MVGEETGAHKNWQKFTCSELLVALFIIIVLASIAIPNLLKYQARCGSSEAASNLKYLYKAQEDYFEKHGSYAGHTENKACFELLDWKPVCGGKILYSYYCDTEVIPNERGYKDCPAPQVPPITATSFTIYAVGNVDADTLCDVWTINDAKVLKNVVVDP